AGTGITCAIGGTSVVASATIVTGQWYHAACTYDGSIIQVYLNGAQINTGAKTGPIWDEVGTDWLIGANALRPPRYS
ncbi:MAG: LamG-like jellyroll fold domain-containing protein, partial [Gammaproteobacteria bacterium]